VSNPRQIQNVALIGFMGTGKSSVGQLMASLLHFTFLDTDQVIETRTGLSIPEIFAQQGEAAFRDLESNLVLELAGVRRHVISTGGGLPIRADNLSNLKAHALVVCLWASPERIWERVRHQTHRPLLHAPDPLENIRTLLAARESFYRQADVLLNTELRSIREVALQAVHQFQLARAQ
jgi:shikimate kinase